MTQSTHATRADAATTPAGIVTRGLAAVVDLVVSIVGVGLIYLGATTVRFVISPRSFHAVRPPAGAAAGVWFAMIVVYLAVGWVTTGRTLGAQLLGLRVVSRSGGPVRPAVAVLRAVLCVVFPVGLLWSAASRRNASVQDLLVRTRVVYDWEIHTRAPDELAVAPSDGDVREASGTSGR